MTLCHDDILTNLGIETLGVIPCHRHLGKKLRALSILIIACRAVSQHLSACLHDGEKSHAVGTCTNRRTVRIRPLIIFWLGVEHSARSEVGCTHGISKEWYVESVVWLATAHLLQSAHSLIRQQVGVTIFQSSWFHGTMIVHYEVMLGSFLYHALIPIYHPLVLTIHEIYLCSCYAPFLISVKDGAEVLLHTTPCQPQDDTDTFLLTVAYAFLQVKVIIRSVW